MLDAIHFRLETKFTKITLLACATAERYQVLDGTLCHVLTDLGCGSRRAGPDPYAPQTCSEALGHVMGRFLKICEHTSVLEMVRNLAAGQLVVQ